MKPGYYACGAGSDVNCQYWDDIDGCLKNEKDCFKCPLFVDEEEDDV